MNDAPRMAFTLSKCAAVLILLVGAPPAPAGETEPDLKVATIPDVVSWGESGGIRAYSIGQNVCNVGGVAAGFTNTPSPNHPVFTHNLYRLLDGRFEQIGQGWAMHGFCALQTNTCGGCNPACGGCCSTLGAGCSSSDTASINGSASVLGPRSEINPHSGANQGIHVMPTGPTMLRGRIQANAGDVDPDLNPGALYFVETQVVAADDANSESTTGDNNNASHRQALVMSNLNLALTGSTFSEQAAMEAWQALDPEVVIVDIDVPNEGRMKLGYRVTPIGKGWHYEYALYNMNSDRAAGSFSVPVPDSADVSLIGFHDVAYHSGELFDGTDWPAAQAGGASTWATQSVDDNPTANALRWGTLYNFRFDSDAPPQPADLTIGLFKTGVPAVISVSAVAPGGADCNAVVSSCADSDTNDIRDDSCVWYDCSETCAPTAVAFGDIGGGFGTCQPDGFANLFDRNHVLTCFGGTNTCPGMNLDIGGPFGACEPDGFCNLFDVVHVQAAFAGTGACSCPAP